MKKLFSILIVLALCTASLSNGITIQAKGNKDQKPTKEKLYGLIEDNNLVYHNKSKSKDLYKFEKTEKINSTEYVTTTLDVVPTDDVKYG